VKRLALIPSILIAAIAVAGPAQASERRDQNIRQASRIAINQTGDPYIYGAAGPNAFDCSGLTSWALHKAGLQNVARTADQQLQQTRRIPMRNHRAGDLVFYGNPAYHVAMFIGKGRKVIEAQRTGTNVGVRLMWNAPHTVGTYR
jgi:cell wall-associated NlpC family hydrolase